MNFDSFSYMDDIPMNISALFLLISEFSHSSVIIIRALANKHGQG